jgi:hypothetical protein
MSSICPLCGEFVTPALETHSIVENGKGEQFYAHSNCARKLEDQSE